MVKNISVLRNFIVICFCLSSLASEKEWFYTNFRSIKGRVKVLSGDFSKSKLGIQLHADSRIKIRVPNGNKIRNGSIHLSFTPPKINRAMMPFLPSKDDCHCAIKIRTGRGEVEVSERWIRVQEYKKNMTNIEKIMADLSMQMEESGMTMELTLIVRQNKLSVLLNGKEVLTTPSFLYDFGDISIATYKKPFELSEFVVSAFERDTIIINREKRYVDVFGLYQPSQFNKTLGLRQHHFIVWDYGRAGINALFTTYASDSLIHEALVAAGAKPGNNLTMDSWNRRNSRSSSEPDKRVEGSSISVAVIYAGKTYSPKQILKDKNSRAFDFRFGGNLKLIPEWRSGCVVCLQSCPGGKIGNYTYTIRDLENRLPKFDIISSVPIKDGEEVQIRFQIE